MEGAIIGGLVLLAVGEAVIIITMVRLVRQLGERITKFANTLRRNLDVALSEI